MMPDSLDDASLPVWSRIIPKTVPGWYWVMRQGMWPKCIRCVIGINCLRPFDPVHGRMTDYTHFIGPCPEPNPKRTRAIFEGPRKDRRRGK